MIEILATPPRFLRRLIRASRKVWVRVALIAFLAVVAAAAAPLLKTFIPERLADWIGANSVRPILNILATSMLAVTTFSLSVMVAAHRAASDNVTPRTHRLLLEDTTTQTVLATFLGAFIYALASIVLLNASIFEGRAIAVIFLTTIVVIVLVVLAILRWIAHLTWLGSMLETTRRVEKAARGAFKTRAAAPFLGGLPAEKAPRGLIHDVLPDRIGYVQHIDTPALRELVREEGADVLVCLLPGGFGDPSRPIARVSNPDCVDRVRKAFTIDDARDFDQDPRFGLIVLSEIASRALSPGVNDPGTAIDVIGRVLRLLADWRAPDPEEAEGADNWTPGGRLFVPGLDPADMVDDGFGAIARDSGGLIEVHLRLQKALAVLALHPDPRLSEAAVAMAARSEAQAEKSGMLPGDLDRLRAVMPSAADPGD